MSDSSDWDYGPGGPRPFPTFSWKKLHNGGLSATQFCRRTLSYVLPRAALEPDSSVTAPGESPREGAAFFFHHRLSPFGRDL